MFIALFRRYKLLFFLGILVLIIQVFLAYKSIKIPIDSGNRLLVEKFNNFKDRFNSIQEKQLSLNDDEDIINSNIQQQDVAAAGASSKGDKDKIATLLSELKFKPKCDILKDKEVISAVQRARTQQCKEHIINIACQIKAGVLYPKKLTNTCPSGNYIENRSLGCFKDTKKHRLLSSLYSNFKETNSPKKCIQTCLQSGFVYAGVQYSTECFCGNNEPSSEVKLADSSCNMKCPAEAKSACGGYFTMNIYETGIAKYTSQIADSQLKTVDNKKVKIVFLLTLNGRALRQVYRLIKSLYSVDHYYFIHVDSRQDYLYRELLKLETTFPNVRLSRKRLATIWGGASLLEMLLSCMNSLLESDWEWDFVLNLSESDFPIKSIDKLTEFLSVNRDKNFVKSHGREVHRFIQKQGLDKTFVECDTHMWRIGDRNLPDGIQIDGGSDWICLSRKFVSYVTAEIRDDLIEGLLKIFQHTLLPAESFFHTAIRNSLFCDTYVDNNLHITNWKRKLGCKCQYRHICDWCGCSPNDFKNEDWPRLQATEHKQLFFGRKFEPVVNQLVILQLEEWMNGPYPHGYLNLNSYWQSSFHHKDKTPPPNQDLLLLANSLIRINSKSNSIQQFYEPVKVLEITDYFDLDVYKGFLIRHEAKINVNLTVELETWCRPNNQHAQVSKTNKLAKKIMQLEVSTDFDQKEQMYRNFPRVIGQNLEPVLVIKLSGMSQVENSTVTLTVAWIDPNDKIEEVGELTIEDITITSINFSKSNMKNPLMSGIWTVKLLQKKTLIGLSKFLVLPTNIDRNDDILMTKDLNASQNQIDKLIANFYLIKDTCISYNQKNIRDIIGTYLTSDDNANSKNIIKFNECKKTLWSTQAPDPKSELLTDFANFDGSSS
ncbi:hypothetical protein PVAND_001203 [Polypedilum vanderplanki]|uniref:protein xylosyltransferase n=1 Tax=Polypedilum vanderplanki TaxID=319348 RepID=A0A9J6BMS9_POLVA|nr:hypothetical protein PVAND_001203 [Polypedilum vanderplanki]